MAHYEKKAKDKRKILISIISLIMAAALILSLFSAVLIYAFAANETSTSSLRSQISDISKEKEQLKKELAGISSEKKTVLDRKSELERKASLNQREIDAADKLIAELSDSIKKNQEQLERAKQQETEQYELFLSRMNAMYKYGRVEFLDVLLSGESFSDIQMRIDIIGRITKHDKELIAQLKKSRQAIETAKAQLESEMDEQEKLSSRLEKTKKELAGQISESETLSLKLASDEKNIRATYEEIEEEEKKLQAELNRILAESASKTSYVGGTMIWPLPGYTTITSPYGYRIHPTLKVRKLHTGVDISAPKGTKILAANAGEVIISAHSKAWGEYVVVNHGGGIATLYAHMSKRLVSQGDIVIQGQNIGLVGSTGYATGNHLHFEIQKNGSSVDPFATEFKK